MEFCHTMDRDNLWAFGECGKYGKDNANWQDTVKLKLQLDNYAQVQNSNHRTCLETYHPNSGTNYMRTYYDFEEITEILSYGVVTAVSGVWIMFNFI